ncbi:MAG: hypothetical protein JSR89_06455 [Proteobacteria bacterium]|nr:hypothetical protein [Pseudomonadota bacterium]
MAGARGRCGRRRAGPQTGRGRDGYDQRLIRSRKFAPGPREKFAIAAAVLARENKALLIGERASDEVIHSILTLAISEPSIEGANNVFAVHLSPEQILVALSLEFANELRTTEIEAAMVRLEDRIRKKHPEVIAVFIKPQTHRSFEQMRAGRRGDSDGTA